MRAIVALCLVATALASSVDWSSLESRDHHIEAVKSVKVSHFPGSQKKRSQPRLTMWSWPASMDFDLQIRYHTEVHAAPKATKQDILSCTCSDT